MTFDQYITARQKAIARLLRQLQAPLVSHRQPMGGLADVLPFDPKVELSEEACRRLLAAGSLVKAR